jgi:hypothetical protein
LRSILPRLIFPVMKIHTEYDVRPLNKHGDAEDVVSLPKLEQAKAVADKYVRNGSPCVVIEKHEFSGDFCTRLRSAGDRYTILSVLGDRSVAKLGGYNTNN